MRDFIANKDGYCVTIDGLDRFWPTDPDVVVDMSSAAFKLFSGGKGGHALPTCEPDTLTYEEQVAPHDLLTFVFNGDEIHTNIPDIPVPGALELMASVLVMALLMKVKA